MNNVFIYTEIYNCGKIGRIFLDSFCKYHPNETIHVYGTPKDFAVIIPKPNIVFLDISKNTTILNAFNNGHLGTAMLWALLIKERPEKYLIHIDSDVICRKECISDLFAGINEGFDLIGPIRNYKHNPNNRDDIRHLADVTQTLFFAFNRELVSTKWSYDLLTSMCRGNDNPLGHSVIDFFDPVMFDILNNGGKIKILSMEDYGGCDYYGKRNTNSFPEANQIIDFGQKLAHFSAVGSGMHYYHNWSKINVPQSYMTYAVDKYALFCKIFYNEDICKIDTARYKPLLNIKDWY